MIGPVSGVPITTAAANTVPGSGDGGSRAALRQFATALRWRHVLGRTCSAAVRWGLLLGVPIVLIAWLLPGWLLAALKVALCVLLPLVLFAACSAWWRGRRVLAALRDSVLTSAPDSSVAGAAVATGLLHDELATWLEYDDARSREEVVGSKAAMLRWLEQDVHLRLAPHRKRALAAISRPTLGRWRWLLPALLLLVLLWLLALWLAPPWTGAVGGRPNQPTSGDSQGEGGTGGGAADPQPGDQATSGSGSPDKPQPEQPVEDPPDPVTPDPVSSESGKPQPEDPEPVPAPPMLDLGSDSRLVLPDFIGDGPTRRALMHTAELEQERAGVRPPNSAGSDGQRRPDETPPQQPEFERAAERAQRARHVPTKERAMVRRFFDKLRQRGS